MDFWLRRIGILLILFIFSLTSKAQIVGTYKRLEIGFGVGSTYYTGDVAPTPHILNTRAGGEAYFRYNFNPAFSGRINFGMYWLAARDENSNDPFQLQRRHRFYSFTQDLSALFEYNFFNFRGTRPYPKFSPYILAGIGTFRFNTSYRNIGTQTSFGTIKGKSSPGLMIPFGVGIKFPLRKKFNIGVELRANKTFTDNLDILGDIDNFSSDERYKYGNVEGNDMYYYLGVSIAYRFITLKCPKDYPARDFDFK